MGSTTSISLKVEREGTGAGMVGSITGGNAGSGSNISGFGNSTTCGDVVVGISETEGGTVFTFNTDNKGSSTVGTGTGGGGAKVDGVATGTGAGAGAGTGALGEATTGMGGGGGAGSTAGVRERRKLSGRTG